MSRRFRRFTSIGVFLSGALAAAWACGPDFPNRLLVDGAAVLLSAPEAEFDYEVRRIEPGKQPDFFAVPTEDDDFARQTSDADLYDLVQALRATNRPWAEQNALVDAYGHVRGLLQLHAKRLASWESEHGEADEREMPPALAPIQVAPNLWKDLPAEFAEYLQGALAYRQNQLGDARRHWEAVLGRPAAERAYRGTWAAYMLGRTWHGEDADRAVGYYRQVRELAKAGAEDSLGLAAASLGWEAQLEMNRGRMNEAMKLYLEQVATDDVGALLSVNRVAWSILAGDAATLAQAARDAAVRRVVTAHLLTCGEGECTCGDGERPAGSAAQAWMQAVEESGVQTLEDADRLAWAAYKTGAFERAERWVAKASDDSDIACWIRAKLLLRAGRVSEAAAQFAEASGRFPEEESWVPQEALRSEMAILHLGRREYAESVELLAGAGYWLDAAYVAERVLTVDELKRLVDRKYRSAARPAAPAGDCACDGGAYVSPDEVPERMRHVLARRLLRAGRGDEAKTYYPAALRPILDEYLDSIDAGRDEERSAQGRAKRLWKAAKIARHQGLELLGTEVEPDWAALGGDFEMEPLARLRLEDASPAVGHATPDEAARVQRHRVRPNQRFHYRYVAADLAWEAAKLMPDGQEATARVLCEAGTWLKNRDPAAADRFYKALVRRCGKTELGREADKKRWFPDLPDGDK